MHRVITGVFVAFFGCSGLLFSADTVLFKTLNIDLPFKLNHKVVLADLLSAEGMEIVLFGKDKNNKRQMAIYTLDGENNSPELFEIVSIPDKFLFFDVSNDFSNNKNGKHQRLLFRTAEDIQVLNIQTRQFDKLIDIKSIYTQSQKNYFSQLDFIKDINGDDRDDIVVDDFQQLRIDLQQSDGSYKTQILPISATMSLDQNSLSYSASDMFFVDMNFDELPDITFYKDKKLKIFNQKNNGEFDSIEHFITLDIPIKESEWWQDTGEDGEGVDQRNVDHQKLFQLVDINADGLTDFITKHSKKTGVLNQKNDYEVYFGKKHSGKIHYAKNPDNIIQSDGTQIDMQLLDLDDDKKLESFVSAMDIGLSQIVGALLTGSIDQDVYFYKMKNEQGFSKRPNLRRETSIKFSLSSGSQSAPVVKVADFNGDGLKDLMLKTGKKTLRVYLGNQTKSLFSTKSIKQKVLLPSDGNMLITKDINQDGKEDVIIRYGREDEEELKTHLTIMMAQ